MYAGIREKDSVEDGLEGWMKDGTEDNVNGHRGQREGDCGKTE